MKNKKFLVYSLSAVIAVMLLLNGIIFYSTNLTGEYVQTTNVWGQSSAIRSSDYHRQLNIIENLPANTADANTYLQQVINYLSRQKKLDSGYYLTKHEKEEIKNESMPEFMIKTDSTMEDLANYERIISIVKRSESYDYYISQIPENARVLASIASDQNPDKDFLVSNLVRCTNDYYGLEYLPLEITLDDSVNMTIQYHLTDFLAFLMVALIVGLFFLYTRKELAAYTLNTGHMLAIAIVVCSVSVLAMYLSNLVIANSVLPFPDLSIPIQSLEAFYTCHYQIPFGSFLLIWLLLKIATQLLILFLLVFAFSFKHRSISVTVAVSALVVEYIFTLKGVSQNGIPGTWHEINIFSGFTSERFFNRYLNLNISSTAMSRLMIFMVIFALAFIIFFILSTRKVSILVGKKKASLQQSYYTEVDKRYQETRRLWHDFNNHLLTIKALYSSGNTAEAEEYIDAISTQGKDYLLPARTGSNAVDLLLFQKNRFALETGIRIEFTVGCNFSKFHFADYELCSLLGNLLDNAIEACRQLPTSEPTIELKMEEHGNMLFISCKNPYIGELHNDEDTFETTKKDTENHGIGLSSVKQVCKKYSGSVEFDTEDGFFSVTCLLNDV